jgi:ligand-binding sensor domain-containing protein
MKRFWLGTDKNGILIYDPKTNDVEQVSVPQGLANNVIVEIIVDDLSNRWVATFDGISVVSPRGKVLYNIRKSDGLIDNQIRPSAVAKLSNGKLAFGGTGRY